MKRAAVLLALLIALGGGQSVPARAGTYTVYACSDGWGTGQNNIFTPLGDYRDGCSGGYGLWADARAPTWGGNASGWQMTAPAGTTISGFSLGYFAEWVGGGYGSQVDDGGFLAGPCFPGLPCGWLSSQPWYASYGWTQLSRYGLSTGTLRLASFCAAWSGCPNGWVHSFFSDIGVSLNDASNPGVAYTSGQLTTGEWARGSRTLGYSASDNSGIRRTRLRIDGLLKSDDARACDYARPVPCSKAAGAYVVDTTQLADGPRAIDVEARDATDSNTGSANTVLRVDNHPPAPPVVTVDGGESARGAATWTVRWTNPAAQAAPISLARYRVCRGDGSGCSTSSAVVAAATGGSSQVNAITGDFGVSAPGDYTLELWLEDAAGNADGSTPSAAVHLRFDDGAPGAAEPRAPDHLWLGGIEAGVYRVPIAMTPGAAFPASGIAGYAVTVDGTAPGMSVNAPGATAAYGPPAGGWPGGTVVVRARAISGAGVPSPQVGQAVLHVDRLAPLTNAEGQGGDWQPGPVTVRLTAHDEVAGSGMGAADAGEPVEAGGRIVYTLDAGAPKQVAGDEAEVVVAGNGAHTIVLRAYDVAGNVSADRTVTVQIGDPLDAPISVEPGFWSASRNPRTTFSAAGGFGGACPALATLAPARDTYVDQSRPGASFSHEKALVVRSGSAANARSLLGFALPAAPGCMVRSARLRLFAGAGGTGGRELDALRLASSWDEDVTWASRPGAGGAAAPGRDGGEGWVEFDVTAQVQSMYRIGDDGLLVRDRSEGAVPTAGTTFGAGDGAPAERPQLVVSFG